jgi:hypothetical protein
VSTAPAPSTADQSTRPDIAHLRCLICHPKWIEGGTYAVCGVLFVTGESHPEWERCVVCAEMGASHFVHHWANGEIPPP